MAFQFRLQKLLDYREDEKDTAAEELGRRQRELLEIKKELERLQQDEQRVMELSRGQQEQEQKLNLFALRAVESYRVFLQERFRCKQQELCRSENQVEQQRQEVVENWRRCQVLEKLKEKDLSGYNKEELKREQLLNDEISLYSYIRAPKGGD